MSQLSQKSAIREGLLTDDLLLSSVIIDQVKKLRSAARTEVDMSTLQISFVRDGLGLFIKTTALEAVTVGSQWVANPETRPPGHGPYKVLTIDHRVDNGPWITMSDGWCGRLDYFHRAYARYVEPVATGKEVQRLG